MLVFLLYTVIFWFAGVAFVKLFYFAIQPQQILDIIFHWQDRLSDLYDSPNKYKNMLGKVAGDCAVCFAHWATALWYVFYYTFCKLALHYWVTDFIDIPDSFNKWLVIVTINIIWFLVYTMLGGFLSLHAILFRKK